MLIRLEKYFEQMLCFLDPKIEKDGSYSFQLQNKTTDLFLTNNFSD